LAFRFARAIVTLAISVDLKAWELEWEDALDPEDERTIPEVIVLIARLRGWM